MAKRGKGEGTIYKRKDGRWAAATSTGNGRRKYVYGRTQAEVTGKLRKAQQAIAQGLPVADERQRLDHFLKRWLESTRATISPSTWDGYERVLRLHIVPEIGHLRLGRLRPQQLADCYQRLLRKGLSPTYVRLGHAVLHRALRQAQRWALIPVNPASLVDAPRPAPPTVVPLSPAQIKVLLTAAEGDRLEALYVLAVTTGLRQGELLGLRWSDIDLQRQTLTVRQQVQRLHGEWLFTEPKTSAGKRQVTLPSVAVTSLRGRWAKHGREKLRAGANWRGLDLVFTNQLGGPIEKQNLIRRSFRPLLERAGLPPIRFHDLRHSAATLLLAEGVHPKVVQERLGHANISVTMDIYSHVFPSLQEDAAKRLDQFFAAG